MKRRMPNIVEIVLIVIAALGMMFGALQYLSTSRPSLYAVVHGYPHYHIIDWQVLDSSKRSSLQAASHFPELSEEIENISGVYHISLTNEGDEVARDAVIVIGNSIGMMILRNKEFEFVGGHKAQLGDIRPGEDAIIVSWSTGNTRLFQTRDPDITITHDNGTVAMDYRYEIRGILRFAHKNYIHSILFGIVIVALALAIMNILFSVVSAWQRSDSNKSKEE